MSIEPRHVPVLADRVLALLAPALNQPNAVLIDATLGHGGHSELALNAFPELTVIGLDRDLSAIGLSTERLAPFGSRIILVHAVYDQISQVLDQYNLDGAQGILFDLGVSSMQLDQPERGFSYQEGRCGGGPAIGEDKLPLVERSGNDLVKSLFDTQPLSAEPGPFEKRVKHHDSAGQRPVCFGELWLFHGVHRDLRFSFLFYFRRSAGVREQNVTR